MNGFEAILFDFDGVLVDSEPLHYACWQEVLAPLAAQLDWDTYAAHCIGVSDRALWSFFAGLCRPPVSLEEMRARHRAKKHLYRQRTGASTGLISDEMRELIAALAGGYKLAVVTSSDRIEVEPVLAAAGLRPHLGALVCGEDVPGKLKPAPEPYLLAAKRLGIRRALVVEDSAAGLASGAAAGFETLHVTHPSRTAALVRQRLLPNC